MACSECTRPRLATLSPSAHGTFIGGRREAGRRQGNNLDAGVEATEAAEETGSHGGAEKQRRTEEAHERQVGLCFAGPPPDSSTADHYLSV
jgi:hypothetical protein